MVTVGRVAKAHGVRGEVSVEIRTDTPDERFAAGTVLRTASPRSTMSSRRGVRAHGESAPGSPPSSLTVRDSRWHQGRLLVLFEGVEGRDAAEALRGVELQVEIGDNETPEDPEEFFDHQLVGLQVVTAEDAEIGEVTEVIHGPAQELLAVRPRGGGEVLVPFVSEIVTDVDVAAGKLVVSPPPGLVDLPDVETAGHGDDEPDTAELGGGEGPDR
ncbi:ribosome maturation factor RimM [Actinobacteria bacterium YIM 96077]|uniref:Ribosome maturation factor RimM n=1 Tax=Phytoactinopolyspora halophila TaxID=1981511 RepID=A0A329QVT4_9ACTN|nr:ribosome maturation factor RimM [Actinobacteria bacterium YIM 96077]RAW16534.1 ribosome maturation factor RimM [Phytoactinopolyspora halophila]